MAVPDMENVIKVTVDKSSVKDILNRFSHMVKKHQHQ